MSSRGGWSRCPGASGLGVTAGAWLASVVRGVAGLGGAWVRPPAGLIWSPAVFGLAVGLGDPWSHCWGVAARWLDTEFCRPRAYGGGLGSCGVAAGAGCDPSCA